MRFRIKGTSAVGRAFAGRRLRVSLAIAAASLLGLSVTSLAQAAPASAAQAHFVIYNAHSRDCISNGGVSNGVVTQYPCNGSTNQQWYWGGAHGSYQQLKNQTTGQCVGLAGNLANGADLKMGSCSSNDQYYWEVSIPCTGIGECMVPPGWDWLQNQASLRVIQVGCNCDTKSAVLIDENPNATAGPPDQLWDVDYGDQGP